MPSLFEDNMEHEDIAIDGYRDILEKIVADPDYTTNVELDLENIFFDAQLSKEHIIRITRNLSFLQFDVRALFQEFVEIIQ